jgi:methylisocitrate lyase
MSAAAQAMRALLNRSSLSVLPGVAEPLEGRIAEDLGFPGLHLGGYAMGASLATSEPLLSLEDVAMCTRFVSRACKIPALVDAGAGWGEPMHSLHAVRVLEHAGAGGLHIEDQQFPKRAHYHQGIEHVIPAEEMVMKLRAAAAGRSDDAFVIVARTDAMATDSYDEGIRRARTYMDAGADAIMCFPNGREEAQRAPTDLPDVPLVYVNSDGNRLGRGVFGREELDGWGWRLVVDAITTTNTRARAAHEVLGRLAETGRTGLDQEEARRWRKFVETTIGLDEHYELERQTVEPGAPEP